MKTLTSQMIVGNWATLLLATDRSGRIDMKRMSDEIDTLIASRPCGIYSNGTACEFYTLSREEFMQISLLLSEKCEASSVPYQIGVSHMSPQESLERLRLVRDLHPGAVQVILPDWFPVTDREAVTYLRTMAGEAGDIPLVLYNPPHAKRVLEPSSWAVLKEAVPQLAGVKVFDRGGTPEWYALMRKYGGGLSIFVPGHRMVSGILNGAHGAYSNVACINPFAAQKWYVQSLSDMEGALELEKRIQAFMSECIDPFIVKMHYPNHACDRFMALVGGWADVGPALRWPYESIPETYVASVRRRAHEIIPEFVD